MRRAVSLLVIFVVSYGVALIVTPPDPITFHLTAGLFCAFGVLGYVLGHREARHSSHPLEDNINTAKP
ncbi:MAG: hypothetical protein WCB27_23590 [Thermoguttaceae bacterium]|jgi:hypothetical protein